MRTAAAHAASDESARATYGPVLLADIIPGPWNPRRRRDPARQAELEASVRAHGVIQPIVVRLAAPGDKGLGQIIAGEGRYLAAKAVGLESIPAVMRGDLTDEQAQELALIENIQRTDLHAIDEAESYAGLMKLDRAYTVESVAARAGKSVAHVRRRLRLLELPKDIREACLEDAITPAHAELLATVPKDKLVEAFEEGCFFELYGARELIKAKEWDKLRLDLAHVSRLRGWIDENLKQDLSSDDVQERLPELAAAVQQATATGAGLVEVSAAWLGAADARKLGIIGTESYREIAGPKERCTHVERAVVTHGGRPRLIDICRTSPCPKHRPEQKVQRSSSSGSTAAEPPRKPNKWELQEAARQKRVRQFNLLKGAAKRAMVPQILKAKLTPALVKNMLRPHELKEVSRGFGLELKADGSNALAFLIANHVTGEAWDRGRLLAAGKILGFDLAKFERQHAAAMKTAKKAKKR